MKKLLTVLMAVAMCFAACSKDEILEDATLVETTEQESRATGDFEVDGIYYSIISRSDLTVAVVQSPNYSYRGDFVIPSTVTYNETTYTVTSIRNDAFNGCAALTSVTIPDGVTSIGMNAFNGCPNLKNINIPDGVTSIGGRTFYGCSSLTSINIPDGVTSIGGNTFFGCSGLTSITIPDGIVSIENYAFYGCSNLTGLIIPDDVAYIGTGAFKDCSRLTSINIPNGIVAISSYTFEGCSSLTSITIPDGVTFIGDGAFRSCSSITSFNIPNGVTSIGASAFRNCSRLTSINIPDGVTSIGEYAFYNSSSLTSLTIPANVISIGKSAFAACSGLSSIVSLNTTPPIAGNDAFNQSGNPLTIYVPATAVPAYKAADVWKDQNIQPIENVDDYDTPELIDGTAYENPVDRHVNTLTYTRTFNNTNWQPLFVPFAMKYEEWSDKADVAELSGVHMYDDGRPTIIEFITVKSGVLWPNTPYVIKAKNTGKATFTLEGCTLYGTPADGTAFVTCSTPRWTYKFVGNYQTVPLTTLEAKKAFIMSGGKFTQSSADLNPERFYMLKEQSENGYWSRSSEDEEICIMVDGKLITE